LCLKSKNEKKFWLQVQRTIGFRIESIIEELFSIRMGFADRTQVSLDNLSLLKINWNLFVQISWCGAYTAVDKAESEPGALT
jgi:hypothetical protein